MPEAWVGLGSNLGHRRANLLFGLDGLARLGRVKAVSRFYASTPAGVAGNQPDFLNAVARLDTALDPLRLLAALQQREREAGRVRRPGGLPEPRTLDLDLLLYEGLEMRTPVLTLPHPRLTARAFVLHPLLETAAPDLFPARLARRLRAAHRRTGTAGLKAAPWTAGREDPAVAAADLDPAVLRGVLPTDWLGHTLESAAALGSTNERLKCWRAEAEREGISLPEGVVVVADRQTHGRGRLGRSWWSPPGAGLYLSVLLRPPPDRASELGLVSLLAGVAVAQAVEDLTAAAHRWQPGPAPLPPARLRLKWPNDGVVQVPGRERAAKVFGILVEAGQEARGPWAVVGIGVNVNVPAEAPPAGGGPAASLEAAWDRPWPRQVLWARLAMALEVAYRRWIIEGPAPLIEAWARRSLTLGRLVAVHRPGEMAPLVIGRAVGLEPDGALLVQDPGGTLVPCYGGEVSIRDPDGSYAGG
ncbi:MAG: biotin--[acetyl-CoA-carboxylase] ligase [Firmicutes bacterium]|nr:biotin--[acetyl-CoA-carboxylase] ligase [Bacillota bacterium]